MHVWPVPQGRLQPPQWRASVKKSTQAPPQDLPGVARRHRVGRGRPSCRAEEPSCQTGGTVPSGGGTIPSGGGTVPSGGGRHVGGRAIAGRGPPSPGISQAPETQTRPDGQARPQPPQCSALVRVSTHAREHSVWPDGQGLTWSSEPVPSFGPWSPGGVGVDARRWRWCSQGARTPRRPRGGTEGGRSSAGDMARVLRVRAALDHTGRRVCARARKANRPRDVPPRRGLPRGADLGGGWRVANAEADARRVKVHARHEPTGDAGDLRARGPRRGRAAGALRRRRAAGLYQVTAVPSNASARRAALDSAAAGRRRPSALVEHWTCARARAAAGSSVVAPASTV